MIPVTADAINDTITDLRDVQQNTKCSTRSKANLELYIWVLELLRAKALDRHLDRVEKRVKDESLETFRHVFNTV